MFRLFGNWNTYLTDEIRAGKHLNKAQKTNYKEFYSKNTFRRLSQWTILYVIEDLVYWGKANQEKVDKYCFFKTSKENIELNFARLDSIKKKPVLTLLTKYICKHIGLNDHQLQSIKSSTYEHVGITEETSFHFVLSILINDIPDNTIPEKTEENIRFDLLVNPHHFALIDIKQL